jgi:hypothetical protein
MEKLRKMKNTGIKNKEPYMEITINRREAKRVLVDLNLLVDYSPNIEPETKELMKMLEKFD